MTECTKTENMFPCTSLNIHHSEKWFKKKLNSLKRSTFDVVSMVHALSHLLENIKFHFTFIQSMRHTGSKIIRNKLALQLLVQPPNATFNQNWFSSLGEKEHAEIQKDGYVPPTKTQVNFMYFTYRILT
jgi:hypothetical protein